MPHQDLTSRQQSKDIFNRRVDPKTAEKVAKTKCKKYKRYERRGLARILNIF
jgi:hypothetical protein